MGHIYSHTFLFDKAITSGYYLQCHEVLRQTQWMPYRTFHLTNVQKMNLVDWIYLSLILIEKWRYMPKSTVCIS